MRWLVMLIRSVFALVLMSGAVIAPEVPGWQIVAGAAYVIGVMRLISALDEELDVVELAVHGMSGPADSPLTAKSMAGRVFVVLMFWFVVMAFGLTLTMIPVVPWPFRPPVGPWCFLAGTLIGAVIYLAAVGWYRKSMRRRYGY